MVGPHFPWLELVIRLGSALVLGFVIGAERQWRQRTAGLRTYSLVSVGAALFVLLAPLRGVQGEATPGWRPNLAQHPVTGFCLTLAVTLLRNGLVSLCTPDLR
jgi:putative Mg2+ transporter-C (MgtC) family protein